MKSLLSFLCVISITIPSLSADVDTPTAALIAKLKADPKMLSPTVAVRMVSRSDGGKNRDTTFKTDYGSFAHTDVSSRLLYCTITSQAKIPQRTRVQCLFISRMLDGARELVYDIVSDEIVTLGPLASAGIAASAQIESSEERYVALGIGRKEGAKFVGWVWRAIDSSNHVCSISASMTAYEQMGRDTEVKPRAPKTK